MFRRFALASVCVIRLLVVMPDPTVGQDASSPEFSPEAVEWFERKVRPLLAEQCSSCHSASVGTTKGGLSLDSREALIAGGESGVAVVPGKPNESLLIEAIRRESYEMPPEKELSARDQRTLVQWVEMGAPWPNAQPSGSAENENWLDNRLQSHWAWQPISKPSVPATPNDSWSASPIDSFIMEKLGENALQPAASCPPNALLRRLSVDLTGLLPDEHRSRSQTGELTEQAYAEEVDRLLSSPQFGVRWGRHWLDLVRYAETLGHEFDYPLRHAWRYRDAVIDTFNTDLPYDQLVLEHIAGDQLPAPRRHPLTDINQSLAMTGFWWLGDSVHAPVDITNDWATRVDNQIDVFSKAFLGMTIACARCHDHKFDAISLKDYYGLSGIIESSRREYAITDPFDRIAEHCEEIQREVERADQQMMAAIEKANIAGDPIRSWLDRYIDRLRELDPEQRKKELALDSPLHSLAPLFDGQPFASALASLKTKLESAVSSAEVWERESTLFARFTDGLPSGWQVQSAAKKTSLTTSTRGTFDWFSESLPLPNRPEMFSSQRLGREQHLTLRSPTFDVTHNMVCLKMRGKSAQSSVVVSNYFMQEFHQLLFKDLRKPIDQVTDSGWIVHGGDLNKYLGHPTFLSIEDEGKAWFEIEEVRFANAPPPPKPAPLTVAVAARNVESEEQLRAILSEQITRAAQQIRQGNWDRNAVDLVRAVTQATVKFDLPTPKWLDTFRPTARMLRQLDARSPAPTVLLATSDGTPRDAAIALRGNPHTRGDVVPRTCFVSLTGLESPQPESSGRVELAKALVDRENPLPARVFVNRIWHHLMGRGLVSSPDNLGVLGGRPTHPELLDYLASEFVRHDWSIKWLVREIVLSRTYQLSSSASGDHQAHDADGSLWSHRPIRRLDAESLRDAMLMVTGSLDTQLAGQSVPVHLNDQMTGRGRPRDSGPLDGGNRRSTYVEVRRNFLDPFLVAFDFPMPSTSAGARNQSNVPAQALGLLNDPLVAELSRRWASRYKHITDPRQRIERMISAAYQRPPLGEEVTECLTFVNSITAQPPDAPASSVHLPSQSAWEELAHVLLNSKEFYYLK